MSDLLKRNCWFYVLGLICLCFLLNSYSCRQQTQAPAVKKPVEVGIGQKVKHTPFLASVARFEAQLAQDVAEDGIGSISAGVVVENAEEESSF